VVDLWPDGVVVGCAVVPVVVVCPGCVAVWVVVFCDWIRFGCAAARCGRLTTAAALPGATVPAGTLVAVTVVREATLGATRTTGPACRQVLPGPTSTLRVIRVYSTVFTVIRLARQSGSLQPHSGLTMP